MGFAYGFRVHLTCRNIDGSDAVLSVVPSALQVKPLQFYVGLHEERAVVLKQNKRVVVEVELEIQRRKRRARLNGPIRTNGCYVE